MQWAWLISGLTAVSLLLGIANMVWAWMSKGGARMAARLEEIDRCTDDHERRIQTVEGELKHLPSKEDLGQLELKLSSMDGKLNSAERELASVARTTRRIEDHLLGMKA